jgi:N-acetylmuramoyl-L-alanine amidase
LACSVDCFFVCEPPAGQSPAPAADRAQASADLGAWYSLNVLAEAVTAALICIDPGHGTPAAAGRQREPIGPGSSVLKEKDGGGAPGEAGVVLAIARRTRALLLESGYRVAMTRTGPTTTLGNVARAQFCNRRRAALMLRIHADGWTDTSRRGVSTLYPSLRSGWTNDIFAPSRRAARLVQRELVRATQADDLGTVQRPDLTGFNWADVPAILVETGFLSNAAERRLLHTSVYEQSIARGLAAGVSAFTR